MTNRRHMEYLVEIPHDAFTRSPIALGGGSVSFKSKTIVNTARQDAIAEMHDLFDSHNEGTDYGVYQRLCSRNDGIPLGEF